MATSYLGRDRRLARPSPVLIALAVLAFCAIVYVTLCPIGLRPRLASPTVERFGAYVVLGALAGLAAGRRTRQVAGAVVFAAMVLEAAQRFAPGRDPRAADAMVKALGGLTGVAAVQARYAVQRLLAKARTASAYAPEEA